MASAAIISTGPQGATRTRATKVNREPYWAPWANEWLFLPVDLAHDQKLEQVDEDGVPSRPIDLYLGKGFMPLAMVSDEEILAKLPVNWKDVARRNAVPEYAEAGKKASGDARA